MSIAVVFPGQGSQTPGAGRAWRDHPAWSLVDEAEDATGLALAHLLLDATDDELRPTRAAQLSVLLSSLLAWRAMEADLHCTGLTAVAGHSLGQITALIAAEVVPLDTGIRLAVARADATAAAQRDTPGAMLALLGATETQAVAACGAAPGRAWLANLNGAGQIVVGATPDAIATVGDEALVLGVRRTKALTVDGAFHTPLMAPAAEAIAPLLADTRFSRPTAPIITNDAAVVTGSGGWPERLTAHLVEPVRWGESVALLQALGANTVVEAGPGTTLTSLTMRIAPDLATRSVASPDHLPLGAGR